jgi:hypothetical protein
MDKTGIHSSTHFCVNVELGCGAWAAGALGRPSSFRVSFRLSSRAGPHKWAGPTSHLPSPAQQNINVDIFSLTATSGTRLGAAHPPYLVLGSQIVAPGFLFYLGGPEALLHFPIPEKIFSHAQPIAVSWGAIQLRAAGECRSERTGCAAVAITPSAI